MSVRRRVIPVLLALVVAGTAPAGDSGSAAARSRYRVWKREVVPGLTYMNILDRRGPNQIRVLKVDLRADLTLDVVLSNDELPGRERTSEMARRRDATAATNGTWGLSWGRPTGTFIEDGDLKTTPLVWERGFAITRNERTGFFGHPELHISARELDSGSTWEIHKWNDESSLEGKKIYGYTTAGGEVVKPPAKACAARLMSSTAVMWGRRKNGVAGDYVVDQVRCSRRPLARQRGIVVATRRSSSNASLIQALTIGETVRVAWRVGWRGILDLLPGNPTLIENGRIVAYDCPTLFCARNPRTSVGLTEDGRLLLATIDGRQPEWSVGMSLIEEAKFMQWLGAEWALNIDGGGSTTMVLNDKVKNRPSDLTGERAVTSALVVLQGPDEDEPLPVPYAPPPQTTTATVAAASDGSGDLAMIDPGSTGGYLDALASGALGRPPLPLDPRLQRIVRLFRASNFFSPTR